MTQSPPKPYRKWPVQLGVLAVTGLFFGMARLPGPSPEQVKSLATRFHFNMKPLVQPAVPPGTTYGINKNAKHLQGWMWNMGASIAMADLDGDGLPNDLCYTDIAAKAVMIAPAPGTGDRYKPFTVDFGSKVDLNTQYPMRCGVSDMNEDGLQDIYVGFAGRTPILLLRKNTGAVKPEALSSASFVMQDLVPDGIKTRWHSTTSDFADIDGDGHLDLLVGNYFPDGANIHDDSSDEPFEMNDTFVRARNGGKDRIFLWAGAQGGENPSVTYKEAPDPYPGVEAQGWTFAIGAADIDRDGLSDLYIAHDYGPDSFFLNRSTPGHVKLIQQFGEPGFSTPRSFIIGKDSFKGMGIDFADINRDGIFDMVVSNISNDYVLGESHFLWLSNGDTSKMEQGISHYENAATRLGVWHSAWAWDIRFDDFDNDGEMEIVQATGYMKGKDPDGGLQRGRWTNLQQFVVLNDRLVKKPSSWAQVPLGVAEIDGHMPDPFYTMGADGKYVDLAGELFPGYTPNARGIATADVDGDGDLDMSFANAWEASDFFENVAPAPGAFLGLHLLMPLEARDGNMHDGHPSWREGTPAVGALVELTHPDGRKMSRQVDGGNGYAGSRAPDLLFGLGKIAKDAALAVKVTWRDRAGAVQHSNLTLKPGWHTVTLAQKIVEGPAPSAVPPVPPEGAANPSNPSNPSNEEVKP